MMQYTTLWVRGPVAQGALSLGVQGALRKPPLLVELVMTPNAYDGKHYWLKQEAKPSARRFNITEELEWGSEKGVAPLMAQLDALRSAQAGLGFDEVVSLRRALLPGDYVHLRPKTADECRMDTAMLQVEDGQYQQALLTLQSAAGSADTVFWHNVARRAYVRRARESGGDAAADWELAAHHAQRAIELLAPILQSGVPPTLHGNGIHVYGFGEQYEDAYRQLVSAATTAGEYWLYQRNEPAQALAFVEPAIATNYGLNALYAVQALALLRLGRQQEAYDIDMHWNLALPELQGDPAYLAHVQAMKAAMEQSEQAQLASLQTSYADGIPATAAELQAVQQRFPQLPAAYLQWLAQPQRHSLSIVDNDQSVTYTLCSVATALEHYDELQDWYQLHRDDPEMLQDLWNAVRDAGFEPRHLLPIVESVGASNYLVLYTEGVNAGKVYYWEHDQLACLSEIVDTVDDLFPWLEARAKAGNTLVM